MTKAEWLVSDNPQAMVYYLAGGSQGLEGDNDLWHVSARKLRLFSCAVARSRWHLLGLAAQGCVEVAERRADGLASSQDRGEAFNRADLLRDFEGTFARACLRANAVAGAYDLASAMTDSTGRIHRLWCDILRDIVGNPFRPTALPSYPSPDLCKRCRGKGDVPAGAGAAVMGRPSRTLCERCRGRGWRTHPWLTSQVLSLTQAAYDERRQDGTLDPHRLAILADALEEAGCTNEVLLQHLRGWEWSPPEDHMGRDKGVWIRLRGPHVRGCWALDLILGKN